MNRIEKLKAAAFALLSKGDFRSKIKGLRRLWDRPKVRRVAQRAGTAFRRLTLGRSRLPYFA